MTSTSTLQWTLRSPAWRRSETNPVSCLFRNVLQVNARGPEVAHGDHAFGDVYPLIAVADQQESPGLDYRMSKSSSLGATTTPFWITNRGHIFFM
jgi:hypothetical protein